MFARGRDKGSIVLTMKNTTEGINPSQGRPNRRGRAARWRLRLRNRRTSTSAFFALSCRRRRSRRWCRPRTSISSFSPTIPCSRATWTVSKSGRSPKKRRSPPPPLRLPPLPSSVFRLPLPPPPLPPPQPPPRLKTLPPLRQQNRKRPSRRRRIWRENDDGQKWEKCFLNSGSPAVVPVMGYFSRRGEWQLAVDLSSWGKRRRRRRLGRLGMIPFSRSSAQNRHPRSLRYQCFFLPFPS